MQNAHFRTLAAFRETLTVRKFMFSSSASSFWILDKPILEIQNLKIFKEVGLQGNLAF